MTEDEAETVAQFAAWCVRWGGYTPVARYGRLFTPGTEVGRGDPELSGYPGRNAYQLAMESGLTYAEGYFRGARGRTSYSAWCLDGETVVHPLVSPPGTAYFGVALRPEYMRRIYADHFNDSFRFVFPLSVDSGAPLDPAADIIWTLGRDIPSWVREWAVSTQPRPAFDQEPPAWIRDEVLRFGDRRPQEPDAYLQRFMLLPEERPEAPLPMSYARYLVRLDARGMWLSCSGRTGGITNDNAAILKQIQDGDSLDTLIRWADEHRPRCEWAVIRQDEREQPELTVQRRAKVQLRWTKGFHASHRFAVLHRLDHHVWDAWQQPWHLDGHRLRADPPVLLTRNGTSYEMALASVFRAMGDELPEKFEVVYLYDPPPRAPATS